MSAILCWLMLVFLAVPALALAETETAPSGGPALLEDAAPLEGYGTIPPGEEIQFEPASPVSPAPSGVVDTPSVTPAPVDPSTDPAPVDPIPPDPVGETPVGETPVGEAPVGETPVEEPPVGSVIENSPEQQPGGEGAYAPPVVAPSFEIPVAAADPLPAEVIPTDLMRRVESEVPPAVEAPVPSSTPISQPSDAAARAATIPSTVLTTARPAEVPVPKPESHFATGRDLVRSAMPPASLATPKRADEELLPATGVGYDEAVNPFNTRLTSPLGPTPSGSQLLEVLAQYVIAGGSGPPTSVALILLVQIATVVAAFALRAPRSMFQMVLGVPDRLSVGYRAVSLRPG